MRNFLIITVLLFCSSIVLSQPEIGENAPKIQLSKFLNNNQVDLKNRFILLDFWATWCGPCIKSFPKTNSLSAEFKNEIVFIAITTEKEETVKKRFLNNHNYKNIIFALDEQQTVWTSFAIRSIPHYYLISPNNKIIASGNPPSLSTKYLDSLVSKYYSGEKAVPKVSVSKNMMDTQLSIKISKSSNSKLYHSYADYSFVSINTLKNILPYLKGVKLNRVVFNNIPNDTIRLEIFSKKVKIDSLKLISHELILSDFSINYKKIKTKKDVIKIILDNDKLLSNKNNYLEPGVLKKRQFIKENSSIRLDNYTLQDLKAVLESEYYPTIFLVESTFTKEYDWEFEFGKYTNGKFSKMDFKSLEKLFKIKYGIDFINDKEMIEMVEYSKSAHNNLYKK